MAMKVCYTVMDGEIISEERGGVESFYVPDAIGSTIAITDNNGNPTDRISYWPYGRVSTRTGSNPTPFQYVGSLGYYFNSADRYYVRARYLDVQSAIWTSQDPLIFTDSLVNAYSYAGNSPVVYTDASGLAFYTDPVKFSVCFNTLCTIPCTAASDPAADSVKFPPPFENLDLTQICVGCYQGCMAWAQTWIGPGGPRGGGGGGGPKGPGGPRWPNTPTKPEKPPFKPPIRDDNGRFRWTDIKWPKFKPPKLPNIKIPTLPPIFVPNLVTPFIFILPCPPSNPGCKPGEDNSA